MNLKRIEYLLQVAELGSFSRAAAVLGITQPSLGRQVQKLEEECAVRLLYRHGRGVALTPDGEKFIARVQPLLSQLRQVAADMRASREQVAGEVAVGMPPTTVSFLGQALFHMVRQQFPGIRLNVVEGYSGHIHEWLQDARLDLAVLHHARRSHHIRLEPLADIRLALICAPHAAPCEHQAHTEIDFEQLARVPLLLSSRQHGLRRTLEQTAQQQGFRLNVAYEVDSLRITKDIIAAGLAHTVLGPSAVREELQTERLVAFPLRNPEIHTRLMLASASQRPYTEATRQVAHCIKTIIERLMEHDCGEIGLQRASPFSLHELPDNP
ncbi:MULTISPECIES: LysR family transcriptional regulator [Giesbergeria]|uniref:LysR family transcriptional regulator n=1 Tax=Giesbergeria sinuosa TaxID=80883 RepID=A0ABV9QEW5_9BURK